MSTGSGSGPDPFADALDKLGKTTEHLAKAVDAFERTLREKPWRSHGPGGGGGGSGGGEQQHGFLRRAFDATRFGQDYNRASGAARRLVGGGGRAGAGGAAGAGRAAGALGGAAAVVGVVVGVGIALNEMRKRIEEWTRAAIESKRHLAEVSGAMANVFANREVREMMRDRQVGDRTAGSTGRLVAAEQARKDASAPIQIAIDNLKNDVLAKMNDGLTGIYNGIRQGVNEIGKFFGADKDLIPALEEPGAGPAFDAITKPGGIIDMADKIEKAASDALDKAKKRPRAGGPFGAAGRPPGRLP